MGLYVLVDLYVLNGTHTISDTLTALGCLTVDSMDEGSWMTTSSDLVVMVPMLMESSLDGDASDIEYALRGILSLLPVLSDSALYSFAAAQGS
jgi:hypothetical protein